MEDIIDNFLSVSSGEGSEFGTGTGSGFGSNEGTGYGDGEGDGYCTDYCSGFGDGSAEDYSCDSKHDIDGYGCGDGYDLLAYNGQKIYIVDNMQTLIKSVHGQYARGSIVNSDLTLTPCYIARSGDCFAHGETLEEARRDAEEKALQRQPPTPKGASLQKF